jgi:hypothetical protein
VPQPDPERRHGFISDSQPTIRWRSRCRIWRLPLVESEGLDLRMAWIPGDPSGQQGEFLLATELVSLRQWREVARWPAEMVELNPDPMEQGAADQPVSGITAEQAQEFCCRLAARSGRYFELPSEDQWEYAALAGSRGPYSWGEVWSQSLAAEVANSWGLRQMHGSLWQWCRWGALRGGSWNDPVERCQASSRAEAKDGLPPETVGLRVCCLPFGTPSHRLEASKRQWRPRLTRLACEQVLGKPLGEAEFEELLRGMQRFRIQTVARVRFFLVMMRERLSHDDEAERHRDPGVLLGTGGDGFEAFAKRMGDGGNKLADRSRTPQEFWAGLRLHEEETLRRLNDAYQKAVIAFPDPG